MKVIEELRQAIINQLKGVVPNEQVVRTAIDRWEQGLSPESVAEGIIYRMMDQVAKDIQEMKASEE